MLMHMRSHQYRVVVEGELGPRYAAAFAPLSLEVGDGTSTLSGEIRDQSELKSVIDSVSRLGLALISVTPVE